MLVRLKHSLLFHISCCSLRLYLVVTLEPSFFKYQKASLMPFAFRQPLTPLATPLFYLSPLCFPVHSIFSIETTPLLDLRRCAIHSSLGLTIQPLKTLQLWRSHQRVGTRK